MRDIKTLENLTKFSAQVPDPSDPPNFGLQKYADPRIRIQMAKNQPKTANKNLLLPKPKSEQRMIIKNFLMSERMVHEVLA